MSDDTPGGDPGGERSPMISRVPWRTDASQPSSPDTPPAAPSSPPQPAGSLPDGSGADADQDEGTRRVTRSAPVRPAAGWGPPQATGTASGPTPSRPSGPQHQPAPPSVPTPRSEPRDPRPSPLGSPQPQRVPGNAPTAPQQRPGPARAPGSTPAGYPTQPASPTLPGHPTQSGDPTQPGHPAPAGQARPGGRPPQATAGPPPGGQPVDHTPPTLGGVSVPQPTRSGDQQHPLPRYGVNDLIAQLNPESQPRSKKGWRARLGLKPSQRELAEVRDDESVRMPFARPVTIMIANPKGGVGKTPTTLMLAAAMGVARGGGVIAWDNNELRGTMPDRSLSPHRRTVRDMLGESAYLSKPSAQFTDLSYYFNHQTTGKFHTLGSAQTSGHVISRDDFETIHNILARFFQVIIVDTGNNEASPNWQAAAEEADCLVVPTKWRKDSLIPAARMLETLQEINPDLLNRTVVVATNGPADSQQSVRLSGAEFFGSYPIVEIPTDPHIAEGGVIDYVRLQDTTRRAALVLAAEVARSIEPVAGLSQMSGPSAPPRRGIG